MTDDKDKLAMPYGEVSAEDLSVGGLGSGGAVNDTGGLDGDGNELGAARPGTDQGREEGKRMDDAAARRS